MGIAAIRRYALRVLVVLLCVAAWADLRPLAGAGDRLPVAVIDVSASVGAAAPGLPEGLRARSHWILVAEGWQDVVGGAEPVRLSREATRLGAALRHVAETWPGADVLLLTDGRATDGDAEAAARDVAARGGRVFTAPPAQANTGVGLDSARLIAAAPRARVRAVVHSSTSGRADVRLVRGSTSVDRKQLVLAPGFVQAVALEDAAPPAEGATYSVVLEPGVGPPDDDPQDKRVVIGLRPERRVALVWGVPEARADALGDDIVVRVARDPDVVQLEGADVVVMANLPWRDVGRDVTRALERFVAGGGRLLLLGGPEAYAAGGWAGQALERRLSPLRVPRRDGTGLALVLALDRSGSTQGATLAHLKNAARRVLQGITPGERMGVQPFAAKPAEALLAPGVLAPDDADGLALLLAALDDIEARGATDLPAAVLAAAQRVHAIEARERRVVLLTDGDPDHPPDVAALKQTADYLADRDIGFFGLVVGDDEAVARLRRHLARTPEEVIALTDAAQLSTHLLHRVATLRGQTERWGRPVELSPRGTPPFDVTAFRPQDVQRLEVATDLGARPLIDAFFADVEPARIPFAAVRAVGAGEVAALAWGPAFEEPSRRAGAFERLGPWIRALASRADRGLAAEIEGEILAVQWPEADGQGAITAASETGAADLLEVRPGLFRGPLPPDSARGVRVRFDGMEGEGRPLRLPSRPPAEHRGAGIDEAALAAIAAAGGGHRLAAGAVPPPPPHEPRIPLAPWLLLAACILLVVDRLWAKPDRVTADR